MPSATTCLPCETELGHLCATHVGAKSHRRHNPPGKTHRKVYYVSRECVGSPSPICTITHYICCTRAMDGLLPQLSPGPHLTAG